MIKKILKKLINFIGYELTKKDHNFKFKTELFKKNLEGQNNLNHEKSLEGFLAHVALSNEISNSQILQDLFVDYMLNKSSGFFCEVGACDGKVHSNTLWLEENKGWTGILCEPSIQFREKIKQNRPNCIIEEQPVFSENMSEIKFIDQKGGRSFIDYSFKSDNILANDFKTMKLKTISLNNLFSKYSIKNVDYLSLDTEGSEYEILKSLDFKLYSPTVITVEHNFKNEIRKKIYSLLVKRGYKRYFTQISRFDDWYVK